MGKVKLTCTGRDVEDRELHLRFNKENCVWDLIGDSRDSSENMLPQEMVSFIGFMKDTISFSGSNTELQEQGVTFRDRRSNSQRLVEVLFSSAGDTSDASDE